MPRTPKVEGDLSAEEQQIVQEIAPKKKVDKRTRAWKEAKAQGKRTADSRARAPSAHETRAQQARDGEEWHDVWDKPYVQGGTLPDIPARTGMRQKWVRVADAQGNPDVINIARKQREGWIPRKVESLPKNYAAPTIQHGQFAGFIGVEGMVLMHMPVSHAAKRQAIIDKKNNALTEAVNQQLAEASSHGTSAFGPIRRFQNSQVGRLREVKAEGGNAESEDL